MIVTKLFNPMEYLRCRVQSDELESFTRISPNLKNYTLNDGTRDEESLSSKMDFYINNPLNFISQSAKEPANSPFNTTFLLLNAMIGSGILAQPYVFKEAGILTTIVLYTLVAFMILFGVEILILAADATKIYDFYGLTVNCMGKSGGKLLDFSIAINNFGAVLSYFIILGSLGEQAIETSVSGPSWYTRSYNITIFFAVFFVLPISLIRHFGHLAWISYISIITIIGTTLMVIILGPSYSHSPNLLASIQTVSLSSLSGAFQSSGSIIFAFNFTSVTFHSYRSMKNKNISVYTNVVKSAIVIGVTICFLMGIFGYLAFRENTQADILDNFNGHIASFFKVAFILHLVLYIPGDFLIMRSSLFNIFGLDTLIMSDLVHVLSTSFLGLSLMMISVYIQIYSTTNDSFSTILNLTGGIAGTLICFIIPGFIGLKVLMNDIIQRMKVFVVIIFGIFVIIIVPVSSLVG